MRNIITYVDANKQHHTIDDISKIKNISINISGDFNILKIHHCPNFKNV